VGKPRSRFWGRLGFNRLRLRILAWSFLPTAVILFAVAFVAVYAYGNVTEQQAIQRNQELARLSAASLSTEINQFALDLDAVARQADVAAADPDQRQVALADAANKLAVFDAGTIILDARGTLVAASPERPQTTGQDWSSRSYFADLLGSSRTVFSNIVRDGQQGAQVIVVAVPIIGSQGEFNGVLAGMFSVGATSVSALYGDIAKLRVGVTGDVYVVDGTGRVIQHPDPTLIGLNLGSQTEVQDVISGESGAVRTRDFEGRDVVAGYAPIPGTDWGLVAVESWQALIRPSQGYRTFLIVLLVLGLVIPSLVVLWGVRRITRPITALTVAAQEVAAGNFDNPVKIETGDELQALAEQFNEMAVQLRESYEELDRRVAARTKELATLNTIATVVSQSLDFERILDDALAKIMEDLGFEAGAAFVVPENEDTVHAVVVRNLSAAAQTSLSAAAADRLREWSGNPEAGPVILRASEMAGSDRWRDVTLEGWRATAQIPIGAKGRVFGDLVLLSRDESRPAQEQLAPLSSVGSQIGMAVENARLYEKAEESAAAAERNRLARDLHDAVSQILFSASLIAEVLPRIYERDPEEGRKRLEELQQLTRGALAEMRTLLLELRPTALAEADLSDLLRQLSESVIGRARIPVEVEIEACADLPPEARLAFYRIAQEGLNNVSKHSNASHAKVALRCEEEDGARRVALIIEDDGVGFAPGGSRTASLGMGIMAERAEAIGATLQVTSSPGEGTRVTAVWVADREQEGATS
jgi:two-component system nitrate/nitrite sensor histidine kinase NarX